MKNKLFAFFTLCSCLSISSFSQNNTPYAGTWQGILNAGVDLRVVFHIREDGKGGLLSTTDSPDQSAFGMKCDTTFVSAGAITIEIHSFKAVFTGRLINDSTLDGTFTQASTFPLTLKKGEKLAERKRPQQPKPPYPYFSYDVEYDNADKTVHFGATLTVPKPDINIHSFTATQYPVAVMITGSGQQDRDETLMGHKPFAVIADYLTRNGIAVLRVDDRGRGKTTGDYKNATSADFANDVEASIEYLRSRPDINKDKIGLIGHSEGGMIAPMVASRRKDINFIILLAGPGIKIIDLMAEQNAAVLQSDGVDEKAVNKFIPLYKEVISAIVHAKDSATAQKIAEAKMVAWASKTDNKTKQVLGFATEKSQKSYINELVPVMRSPWFRYFLSFDPQPYLKQLNCKVLALNGSRDIQVISGSNLAGIEASLKKSNVKVYEVNELQGLNHLFQTCTKCTVNEYGELEETFSPRALSIMSDWLNKNVK